MKTMSIWETNLARELSEELAKVNSSENFEPSNDQEASHNKIETLKELTFRILREVQSMREVGAPIIDNGIDFYAEVTRFEIDLISRALLQTRGHQGRAARLLNLKITTLNSKIKHYGIEVDRFVSGFTPTLPANGNGVAESVTAPVA
jgi:transcriptional regulator with GAF, ATPase, and Fis domain